YAAVLSTFLGFRAIYINRLRILADMDTSDIYEVHLTNLSSKPVIIRNFEFFWDNEKMNWHYEAYDNYISIPSYSVRAITIEEPFLFSLNKNGNLYIKLHIKGRRVPKKLLL